MKSYKLACTYCGEIYISHHKKGKYCSKKCKDAFYRNSYTEKAKGPTAKYVNASKLTEHIIEAREAGMSYAEMQMAETLRMIPKIKLEV